MPQTKRSNSNRSANSKKQRDSGEMQPSQDFVEYLKAYAREKPDVAALWCFGIGFVVGWKLKPW